MAPTEAEPQAPPEGGRASNGSAAAAVVTSPADPLAERVPHVLHVYRWCARHPEASARRVLYAALRDAWERCCYLEVENAMLRGAEAGNGWGKRVSRKRT